MLFRILMIVLFLTVHGCGRDAPPPPPEKAPLVAPITQTIPVESIPAENTKPIEEPTASVPIITAQLNVITFPSLVAPLTELGRRYSELHPGQTVQVSGHELTDAIRRIGGDNAADVLVVEGMTAMEVVRPTGVVDWGSVSVLTHLPLTVTVAEKPVKPILTPQSLDQEGIRVGFADPRWSAGGIAAKRLLRRLKIGKQLRERVLPGGALRALKDSVVDAYIGWGVLNADSPTLTLPASLRELLPIPAAVISRSKNVDAARMFLDWVGSAKAHDVWTAMGSVVQPGPNAPVLPTILPSALPTPRYWAGAVGFADQIVVAGGRMGAEDLDALTLCSPARTRCQNAKVALPTGRHGVTAIGMSANTVLLAGGLAGKVAYDEVYLFNVADEQLDRQNVSLPRGLGRSAAIRLGEDVYLFGGRGTNDERLQSIVQLNVSHARCEELDAQLPSPRSDLAAVATNDGRVLLLGGDRALGPTAEILLFDPEKMTLESTTMRLPGPVADMTAIPSDDGWLLLGGRRSRGLRDEVDYFEADGTTRRLGQRLPYAVSGASIVTMGDHIYVLGGMTPQRIENRIVRWPR